jgi:hypothetical protein
MTAVEVCDVWNQKKESGNQFQTGAPGPLQHSSLAHLCRFRAERGQSLQEIGNPSRKRHFRPNKRVSALRLRRSSPRSAPLRSIQVASASGDVRRALELCRRAAELAAVRQKEALTSSVDVLTSSGDVAGHVASKEPNSGSGSGSGSADGAGPSSAGAGPSSAGALGEGLERGADVLVELRDVDAAVREMFDSPHIKVRREHL